MLFPVSADSASTSALLSLWSSFIASLQSLASLDPSSRSREGVQQADIFLVDVVHCRIFPKAVQCSEEIPADDSPGISLSELGGLLCSPCDGKSSSEEAMVRSRIELWYNSDVRQAEPFIDDDVVYLITVSSTG
ncbi:hypothetical protein RB195_003759 [Necator americanus]|uniref:Uncharacterized protein n=1 Tax=Necator americanus TaxID=51031 RepID=A0ABR1DQ20_NECAM